MISCVNLAWPEEIHVPYQELFVNFGHCPSPAFQNFEVLSEKSDQSTRWMVRLGNRCWQTWDYQKVGLTKKHICPGFFFNLICFLKIRKPNYSQVKLSIHLAIIHTNRHRTDETI